MLHWNLFEKDHSHLKYEDLKTQFLTDVAVKYCSGLHGQEGRERKQGTLCEYCSVMEYEIWISHM
jgi:hypothetical protein